MDIFRKLIIIQNWLKKELQNSQLETCLVSSKSCSNNIIAAHSIQKSKVLTSISNGSGHVIGFSHNESIKFERIGINRASVFRGYCSKHDNDLFEYIDNDEFSNLEPTQAAFLYALRVLSRELFAKSSVVSIYERLFDLYDNGKHNELRRDFNFLTNEDLEMFFGLNSILRSMLVGMKIGQSELDEKYRYFLGIYEKRQFYRVKTKIIVIPKKIEIASAAMFAPEYNFEGQSINQTDRLKLKLKSVFMTIIPSDSESYVLISYLKKEESFLKSFLDGFSQDSLSLTLERIQKCLLIHCENSFFSESLISTFNDEEKKFLYKFFWESSITTNMADFYRNDLVRKLNLF